MVRILISRKAVRRSLSAGLMIHVLHFGIAIAMLSIAASMAFFGYLTIKDREPLDETRSNWYLIAFMVLLVGGTYLLLNEVIAIFFL
jgi:K+-sensing histidine kinase KdpD